MGVWLDALQIRQAREPMPLARSIWAILHSTVPSVNRGGRDISNASAGGRRSEHMPTRREVGAVLAILGTYHSLRRDT